MVPRLLNRFLNQGRKTNPNPNFCVRIFSVGVGVFHVKGWGLKGSVCPSKPGKPNFFGGISRDFAGISWRCPKSLRKQSLCSIFVPYSNARLQSQCSCTFINQDCRTNCVRREILTHQQARRSDRDAFV